MGVPATGPCDRQTAKPVWWRRLQVMEISGRVECGVRRQAHRERDLSATKVVVPKSRR